MASELISTHVHVCCVCMVGVRICSIFVMLYIWLKLQYYSVKHAKIKINCIILVPVYMGKHVYIYIITIAT